ncbi:WD repeat-containing protein 43 [Chamberlinius hualienensis]
MAARPLISYSDDGEFLACYGADGSLKIWETSTGTLKQEYVSMSQLGSICTSLSWMPSNLHQEPKSKRKKRKSEAGVSDRIVVMGTLTGNILIYNYSLGDLQMELSNGHSQEVTDLQWNLATGDLYSCCHDGCIIQWDIHKGRVKSKWKDEKGGVINCMVISPDGETLFTAGKKIMWWDIDQQRILKKFNAHATRVNQLKLITFPGESTEDGYLVSAAAEDRLLSVWSLKGSTRSALLCFNLLDDSNVFDVCVPPIRNDKVIFTIATKSGILQLFEQQLNGKRSSPKESQATLQIAGDASDSSRLLPILACRLFSLVAKQVAIAYDNGGKLCFESMELSTLKKTVCLVRSLEGAVKETSQSKFKVKEPNTTSSKSVPASSLAPALPSRDLTLITKKRSSSKDSSIVELPMDKRLGSLKLNVQPGEDSRTSSDNVAHLLIQGLHSNDKKILNQVFGLRSRESIEKTVQRLPIETIIPAIRELQLRIETRWNSVQLLIWIKTILIKHTSYLASCSELQSILNPLYQSMDVKMSLFKKMSLLQGKMDLMLTRIEASDPNKQIIDKSAIFSYQDESSDEEVSDIEDVLHNRHDGDALDILSDSEMHDDDDEVEPMEEDANSDSS